MVSEYRAAADRQNDQPQRQERNRLNQPDKRPHEQPELIS